MINETLKGLDFCFTYIDDIIIYSRTEREHLDHIKQISEKTVKIKHKTKSNKMQLHSIPESLSWSLNIMKSQTTITGNIRKN